MRRSIAPTALVALAVAVPALAADLATREECVLNAKGAAQLIEKDGLEAGVAELNRRDGHFVWKDSYVFLMSLDGKMLAHPMNSGLVGKNVLGMRDKGSEGKFPFREFVAVARDRGEGWVEYMWPKPGQTTPVRKLSYILRVPGQPVLVGAGIYPG